METAQAALLDHLPEQMIPFSFSPNTSPTVQEIVFSSIPLSPKIGNTLIDHQHEKVSETLHLGPQLTAEDFLTIFQTTSKPQGQILSLALQNANGVNNLANQIALFQKINQSSLPKRLTSWIIKEIQHFLNNHQDPQSSMLCKVRLRNKSVLMGYIMFSIFQLKCNEQSSSNQGENIICKMKQSQITILSMEISGQIQRKFYHMFAGGSQKKDEERYIKISENFLEYVLNTKCSQIRDYLINPSIYYSNNVKLLQSSEKQKDLTEKQDKLTEFFQRYNIQIELVPNSMISSGQPQHNSSTQAQRFQQPLKQNDQKNQLVNILSISHEQTSCDSSNVDKQKPSQPLKCQQIFKEGNIPLECQEIFHDRNEATAQVKNNAITDKQCEAILITQINAEITYIIQAQAQAENQVQQIQNQNIPELQVLCSTMDTSQVALSQPQIQPILQIQAVAQNMQESKQVIEHTNLNQLQKEATNSHIGLADIEFSPIKKPIDPEAPENQLEQEVIVFKSPILTIQKCQNLAGDNAFLIASPKKEIPEQAATETA